MLARLYIDNYASFVNFEFRPAQTNLLIGENGSGKTKLLEVMSRIIDLTIKGVGVEKCFSRLNRTAWDPRDKQTFEIDVNLDGDVFKYVLVLGHEKGSSGTRTSIASEEVMLGGAPLFRYTQGRVELFNDDHSSSTSISFSNKRSFLPNVETSSGNRSLGKFLSWYEDVGLFRLDPAKIKRGWIARNEDTDLSENGSNFAAYYRYLMQEWPDITERVQDDLRKVIEGFDRMRLVTLGDRKGLMVDFSSAKGRSPYLLRFSALSDGQVVLIVLYTIIRAFGESASLLCIDEPDNFVALREIQPWLQALSDREELQTIIISHNPEVIDYLAADTTFLLTRRGSGLTRLEEVEFSYESALKASEQIARGLIGEDGAE